MVKQKEAKGKKEDSLAEKDIVTSEEAPEIETKIDSEGEFEEFGDDETEEEDDSDDF
jgi:hypothetical protein